MEKGPKPSRTISVKGDSFVEESASILQINEASNGIIVGILKKASPLKQEAVRPGVGVIVSILFLGLIWLYFARNVVLDILLILFSTAPLCWLISERRKSLEKLRNETLRQLKGHRLMAFMASADIREIKSLMDTPFEPVVIAVDRHIPKLRYFFLVGMPLSMGLAVVIDNYFGSLLASFALFFPLPIAAFLFWLFARLNTHYYRITPGTMDLMRFKTWTGRESGEVVAEWNLRTSDVACFENYVVMSASNEAIKNGLIDVHTLSEPQLFVYSVFRAAISSATPPSLPPDRLP